MTKAMNSLLAVFGIWLVISPFLLSYAAPGLWVGAALGLIVLVLSIVVVRRESCPRCVDYVLAVLGVCLVAWGVVGLFANLGGAGANEIIVGALIAIIAFVATCFSVPYKGASFYDRGGAPMVDVKSLRLKDDTILMKAMLLQSMPSMVYVRPDEVWKVLTMIPFDLIKGLPKFLVQGYRTCKLQEKEAAGNSASEK